MLIVCLLMSFSLMAENTLIKMQTSEGDIFLKLYDDKAPQSVANFLQYVNDDFYDGTIFHRVISTFMIQGGGFSEDLQRKPTRAPIENEADNGLKNEIGTIAMARTGNPHSATSQFFINVGNNKFLNYTMPNPRGYGYTVFGRVISGMEVVDKISATPTGASKPFTKDVPKEMIVIKSISTIESVSEEMKPVK